MTECYQNFDNNILKTNAACDRLLAAIFSISPNKHRKKRSPKLFDMGNKNEWLTTKEAANFLGVSPNALRIKVCRGQIVASKLGSHLRFRIQDLRKILFGKRG